MPRLGQRKRLTQRKRTTATAILGCTPRPSIRRKKWTHEQMVEAMKAGEGVNQAARAYGFPLTTLKDRISGRVIHGTKSGPKPYLSPNEEVELAQFLKDCAEVGYGRTRKNVMHIAQSVASEKGVFLGEPRLAMAGGLVLLKDSKIFH